jgi:hypothetical protein
MKHRGIQEELDLLTSLISPTLSSKEIGLAIQE